MYSPNHFKIKQAAAIEKIISNHPLATIVQLLNGNPHISLLPLVAREEKNGGFTLVGHCARRNPQAELFAKGLPATLLFHGPNHYISPAWYTEAPDNVSTWNYIAIQIEAIPIIIKDPQLAYQEMIYLTDYFERQTKTNWKLPKVTNTDLREMLEEITIFHLRPTSVQAKFKLSQNQIQQNQSQVANALSERSEAAQALANWMRVL